MPERPTQQLASDGPDPLDHCVGGALSGAPARRLDSQQRGALPTKELALASHSGKSSGQTLRLFHVKTR